MMGLFSFDGNAAEAVCRSSDGVNAVCNGRVELVNDIDNKINGYESITINTTAKVRRYGLDLQQAIHHVKPNDINITTMGVYLGGILGQMATEVIDGNIYIKMFDELSLDIFFQSR
ncbi:hypothetical protein DPY73_23025 [Salmonella enterica subsp. enterica]|nr:hypothetical protein [Salmonella enterica subsp. enterica serovar Braenderup]